jgi:hypothetical protein
MSGAALTKVPLDSNCCSVQGLTIMNSHPTILESGHLPSFNRDLESSQGIADFLNFLERLARFQKFEVITEADLQESSVRIVSNDVADIEMRGIRIVCLKDRLSIGTHDPSRYEMMQDWLSLIIVLLPHTPVTALGINPYVHYRMANDTERWHRIGHKLAPKKIWEELFTDPGMQRLTIKCPRTDKFEGAIYVTVEPSVRFIPGLYVLVNHHFEPSIKDDITVFSNFFGNALCRKNF